MTILKKFIPSFSFLAGLLLMPVVSVAADGDNPFKSSAFQVFYADVNGDGRTDLLLKSIPKTLILDLDDDMMVPVVMNAPIKSFILLSNSDGSYSITLSSSAPNLDNSLSWVLSSANVSYGNVQADGSLAMFIAPGLGNAPGFVITSSGAGAPQLYQAVSQFSNDAQFVEQNVPTQMITGQRASVSVKMKNTGTSTWARGAAFNLGAEGPRDNLTWGVGRVRVETDVPPGQFYTFKFEVVVVKPGAYDFQWRMVEEGKEWFGTLSPSVQVNVNLADPVNTWSGLQGALNRADKTSAVSYFVDAEKYGAIFDAMGDQMPKLLTSLSGFNFIEIASTHATAVVNQTDEVGTVSQHYVTFVLHGGVWLIADF